MKRTAQNRGGIAACTGNNPAFERLGELEDGSLLWLRGTGNIATFVKTENGYASPAGADYTLEETEGRRAIKDGGTLETCYFDAWGLLAAREDIFGRHTTYAYDGDRNRVYQVNYNPEKDEDFSRVGKVRIRTVEVLSLRTVRA